jgi:hypothetical protein
MDAPVGPFAFVFHPPLSLLDALIVLAVYALPILIVGQDLAIYIWRINPAWWQRITHAIPE